MHILKKDLTQQDLQDCLDYCAATGHLTWRKKISRKVVIGNRAGTQVAGRDNRIIKIFGEVYIEHRLIWLYVTGHYPKSDEHIDHIDHNESNNSWSNLRLVSQAENNKNLSRKSTNTSGVTGVWVNPANSKKKFMAEISLGSVRKIKSHYTMEEAIATRKTWENELGFHSNHGIDKPI